MAAIQDEELVDVPIIPMVGNNEEGQCYRCNRWSKRLKRCDDGGRRFHATCEGQRASDDGPRFCSECEQKHRLQGNLDPT